MADGDCMAIDRLAALQPPSAPQAAPRRHSALYPSPDEREAWDNRLTRQLRDAVERVAADAVTPTIDRDAFRNELAEFNFRDGRPNAEVLDWVIAQLERGVVHMTHPRYFGLFNPAPAFPAQCADRIAAVFNPQLATSTTSPIAVEIEAHVIHAVAQRARLPVETIGHFTTGGAEANYTALICALTRAHPDFAAQGARAFAGQPVFYVSRESHLAWFKIAHQAGIGRDAVHLITTDGNGRLDVGSLAETIAADKAAGNVPVMIVATAGTTNAGMIDPLDGCAELAAKHGIWYHVDAAWGGALISSPRLRGVLVGIERADSVTIDAHKWFAATMGCGMFFTTHPGMLSETFHVTTGYMPSAIGGVDPYVTSMQWSRRFVGLRLFLSLAVAGWNGYATHVEHAVGLIALLKNKLSTRGWTISNQSEMAVLCVEPPAGSGDVRSLVKEVLASGQVWVSVADFEGRMVIRACVTNGETSAADVDILVGALEAARNP